MSAGSQLTPVGSLILQAGLARPRNSVSPCRNCPARAVADVRWGSDPDSISVGCRGIYLSLKKSAGVAHHCITFSAQTARVMKNSIAKSPLAATRLVLPSLVAATFLVAMLPLSYSAEPGADDLRRGPPGGKESRPLRGHPLLKLFDSDGDQKLSSNEIAAIPRALLAFDANGDQTLDEEELSKALPPPPKREERT